MREYEIMAVYDLAVAEAGGADASTTRLTEAVEKAGGTMLKVDHWGRRRMAYPINDSLDADYIVSRFEIDPLGVATLNAALNVDESVYRHIVVRADELPPPRPEPVREYRPRPAFPEGDAPAAPPPASADAEPAVGETLAAADAEPVVDEATEDPAAPIAEAPAAPIDSAAAEPAAPAEPAPAELAVAEAPAAPAEPAAEATPEATVEAAAPEAPAAEAAAPEGAPDDAAEEPPSAEEEPST